MTERLERYGIMREEFCILKALVLVNADMKIEEPVSVCKLRDTILTSLLEASSVLRPGNAAHVNNLLLALPMLRQCDGAVKRFWGGVRREGKVVMNKLFVEMLEAHFR